MIFPVPFSNHAALLSACDIKLREGNLKLASSQLQKLGREKLDAEEKLIFAQLLRRSGNIFEAHKVLGKLSGDKTFPGPLEHHLRAEYCLVLARMGLLNESLRRLHEDPTALQHAFELQYALGVCHLIARNSEEAMANFQRSMELLPRNDSYNSLLTRVNLAAATLSGAAAAIASASPLVESCLQEAAALGSKRLMGNCLEMKAQLSLQTRDFAAARAALREAEDCLPSRGDVGHSLIQKWQTVTEALESGSTDPLLKLRTEETAQERWENVRSIDESVLKVHFNERRFQFLYAGSAYAGYRRTLRQDFSQREFTEYLYGNTRFQMLDIQEGTFGGRKVLEPGKLTQKILSALLLDFYKPLGNTELFSILYSDESFRGASSLKKIQDSIFRARSELESSALPIQIDSLPGGYKLRLREAMSIRLRVDRAIVEAKSLQQSALVSFLSSHPGAAISEISAKLEISVSSCRRLLLSELARGTVESFGKGRSAKYRLRVE